jgi:hypothetical protein
MKKLNIKIMGAHTTSQLKDYMFYKYVRYLSIDGFDDMKFGYTRKQMLKNYKKIYIPVSIVLLCISPILFVLFNTLSIGFFFFCCILELIYGICFRSIFFFIGLVFSLLLLCLFIGS